MKPRSQWFPIERGRLARRYEHERQRQRILLYFALVGLTTGSQVIWIWLLLAAIELGARLLPPQRKNGLLLDDAGLHEYRDWRCVSTHALDSIRRLRVDNSTLTITAGDEVLKIRRDEADVDGLVHALGHSGPAVTVDEVATEQIAGWLGTVPGEWRRVERRSDIGAQMAVFLGLLPACWLLSPHRHSTAAGLAVLAVAYLLEAIWAGGRLEVSDHGLRGRGWRLPWSGVHAVKPRGRRFVVETDRGELVLQGPYAAQVADAARQILNARLAGQVLPSMSGVPDSAISRAESVDLSAERGLSRPE